MPTGRLALEIAVQDPRGADVAAALGADRVELCSALVTGGLTPSLGLVDAVLEATAGHEDFVHVLVRPRGGGFRYDGSEVEVMECDIRMLRELGVAGVVIGALDGSNRVDLDAMRRLMDAAEHLEVTFHRAIDTCAQPVAVLEQLLELGVGRVLTSGGASRSVDGLEQLTRLAAVADGHIQIMAGGGVRIEDIHAVAGSGVDAVHLSARTTRDDAGPSGPGGGQGSYDVTDAELVRAAVDAVAATSLRTLV
ncbi:copper homeostasis protein CutC [Arthrobacter sp. 179]|uniref:copper homeostasis protein CutC n=1 Tax=Arthrobacter sp. 179 TaxID=3457734 RepID=UPI0040334EE4